MPREEQVPTEAEPSSSNSKAALRLLSVAAALFVLVPVSLLLGIFLDNLLLIFVSIMSSLLVVPVLALGLVKVSKRRPSTPQP